MDLTLAELADRIEADLDGDPDCRVSQVATLQSARPGDVAFLSNRKYRKYLADTRASAVIMGPDDTKGYAGSSLVMINPYLGYARAAAALNPAPPTPRGRHPTASVESGAVIDDSAWVGPLAVVETYAEIGAGAFVGPGCVVGRGARIGAGSRLVASVTLGERVVLGARVLVQPGAVIGGDGFGFANDGGVWVKIPQLGTVIIGDDVEVGANTTIDRGALEDTVIGNGVKLDNQIQVGHNVRVGANTAVAGCVGIAGSAAIGENCLLAGGVGVSGHLEIADNVHVTAMTMVHKSLKAAGIYSAGMPIQDNRSWRRNAARMPQLDELAKRVRALEKGTDKA